MTELLRAISATLGKSARAQKPSKLLSLRQAARLLGIDRNITLHELISSGQLKTVSANGKVRIPADEVERLCREGFDSTRAPRRPRRRVPKPLADNLGAKIRSLKL